MERPVVWPIARSGRTWSCSCVAHVGSSVQEGRCPGMHPSTRATHGGRVLVGMHHPGTRIAGADEVPFTTPPARRSCPRRACAWCRSRVFRTRDRARRRGMGQSRGLAGAMLPPMLRCVAPEPLATARSWARPGRGRASDGPVGRCSDPLPLQVARTIAPLRTMSHQEQLFIPPSLHAERADPRGRSIGTHRVAGSAPPGQSSRTAFVRVRVSRGGKHQHPAPLPWGERVGGRGSLHRVRARDAVRDTPWSDLAAPPIGSNVFQAEPSVASCTSGSCSGIRDGPVPGRIASGHPMRVAPDRVRPRHPECS